MLATPEPEKPLPDCAAIPRALLLRCCPEVPRLDMRRAENILLQRTVADLVGHVGGNPTAVEIQAIGQAARMRRRIALLDAQAEGQGGLTPELIEAANALENALRRALAALKGGRQDKPIRPRLHEYLAQRGNAA